MTTTSTTTTDSVTIAPDYRLAIAITVLSVPLLLTQLWLGLPVALFGLFLLYQSKNIRLTFTSTALDVYRNDNRLKTFPYAEWESWTVFWPPIPILFYFKEVNSIHFLPVLFNPTELREQLQTHCPDCAV